MPPPSRLLDTTRIGAAGVLQFTEVIMPDHPHIFKSQNKNEICVCTSWSNAETIIFVRSKGHNAHEIHDWTECQDCGQQLLTIKLGLNGE